MRFRFGDCTLDEESRELQRAGEKVHLTPKAFQLLTILLQERPRAVSKSELQNRLWPTTFVSESNLPTLVREVREGIGDSARGGQHLRTIHRFGYSFAGSATELRTEDSSNRSVAVFPFDNPSGDPALTYVAAGIPEGLINILARTPGLRVTPRSTAFRLAPLVTDPAALQKRLRVRWLITGSVKSSADAVILQVDLIDIAAGKQIWGSQFRRRHNEFASLDCEIAHEVLRTLSPQSRPEGTGAGRNTNSNEAHLLQMKGTFHWNRRTASSLQRAVECFTEAAAIDSGYVPPLLGLAECWVTIGTRDLIDPREAFARAEESARAALAIDGESAAAIATLAAIDELHHWNWEAAEGRYRKALTLSPEDATILQWYALHLSRRGRHEEARIQMDRAAEIDPLSLIIGTNRGLSAYLRGDHEAAVEMHDQVLGLDPNFEGALIGKALALDQMGEHERAWPLYEKLAIMIPDSPFHAGFHAYSLAAGGRCNEARELADRLLALRSSRFVSGIILSLPFLGLQKIDESLHWLETGVDQRSALAVYLLTEPRLAVLRGHPRFEQLVRRVNLADGTPAAT